MQLGNLFLNTFRGAFLMQSQADAEDPVLAEAKEALADANSFLPTFRRYFENDLQGKSPNLRGETFESVLNSIEKEVKLLESAIESKNQWSLTTKTMIVGNLLTELVRGGLLFSLVFPETKIDKAFIEEMRVKLNEYGEKIPESVVTEFKKMVEESKFKHVSKMQDERKELKTANLETLLEQIENFEIQLNKLKDKLILTPYTSSEKKLLAEGKSTSKDDQIKRIELCLKEIRAITSNPKLHTPENVDMLRKQFYGCIQLYDFAKEEKEYKINVEHQPFVIENLESPRRTLEEIMSMINLCKELKNPPHIKFGSINYGKKREIYLQVENARAHLEQLHLYQQQLLLRPSKEEAQLINFAMMACKYVIQMENLLINDSSFFQNSYRVDKRNAAMELLGLVKLTMQEIKEGKKSEINFQDEIQNIAARHPKLFKSFDEDVAELFDQAQKAFISGPKFEKR